MVFLAFSLKMCKSDRIFIKGGSDFLIEKYMIMYDSGIFEVFLYFPDRVDRKYRNNRNLDIYFRP